MATEQHLGEDYAESPDVGTLVCRNSLDLFRCHVHGSAVEFEASSGVKVGDDEGKAEINDLRDALRGQKDIGWFDIAMDDALAMSFCEPAGSLTAYIDCLR